MRTSDTHTDKTLEELEARLTRWGEKIDEFATAAGTKAKAAVLDHHKDLNKKRVAARAKLDELKSAGADRWPSVKESFDAALEDLEAAIKPSGPPEGSD